MALWQSIIIHPGFPKIQSLYTDQFPVEVRFVCAAWIEEQMMIEQCYDLNDPQIEQRATDFVNALRNQVLQKIEACQRQEDMPVKVRLEQAVNTAFAYNSHYAFAIYKKIRETINIERQFLSNFSDTMTVDTFIDAEAHEIEKLLGHVMQATQTVKDRCDQLVQEVEEYSTYVQTEMPKLLHHLNVPSSDPDTEMLRIKRIDECTQRKLQMEQRINNLLSVLYRNISEYVIIQIDDVQKKVIVGRLAQWQRNQVMAGNGAPLTKGSLDDIQNWFEKLFDSIWLTRSIIMKIRTINEKLRLTHATFDESLNNITILLQNLIVSGFVVEKQPPQVMKTNTRYVRCVPLLWFVRIGFFERNKILDCLLL